MKVTKGHGVTQMSLTKIARVLANFITYIAEREIKSLFIWEDICYTDTVVTVSSILGERNKLF